MIRAVLTPRRLTVMGHADYAPHGQDIVCAAVSALVYALMAALEEKGLVAEVRIRSGVVTVAAQEGCEAEFALVRCGLRQLSARYPQCVRVE